MTYQTRLQLLATKIAKKFYPILFSLGNKKAEDAAIEVSKEYAKFMLEEMATEFTAGFYSTRDLHSSFMDEILFELLKEQGLIDEKVN